MTSPLPNYLRTHRKRSGLSQDEVAFLLGTKNGSRISRYENFHQQPSLKTAIAYEFLFRTPIREQFSGVRETVERGLAKRAERLARKLEKPTRNRQTETKLKFLRKLISFAADQSKGTV